MTAPAAPGKRNRRRLGRALLGLGLAALATAHLVPMGPRSTEEWGWQIWPHAVRFVLAGGLARDVGDSLGFTSFVTLVVLVTALPLLAGLVERSRVLKALAAALLAAGAGVMAYFLAAHSSGGGTTSPFLALLTLAPACSFAGILVLPPARQAPPGA